MSVRVLFETSTIAAAISKAAKVAPSRGEAFDKAHGILIDITPHDPTPIRIRSTNTQVYYSEWVGCLEVEGSNTTWRLPSQILDRLLAGLPIGSNKTVEFAQTSDQVIIKTGRTQARLNTIDPQYYPQWAVFKPEDLQPVANLGSLIAQVEWAAAQSGEPPLTGIHFDGKVIFATDRYRVAKTDCIIPHMDAPLTIPAGMLGGVVRPNVDTKMGATEHQVLLMPDDHTQIRATIFGHPYPDIDRLLTKITNQTDSLEINREALVEVINRAMTFAGADRTPTLRLYIGNEEVGALMSNDEIGMLGDVVETPGYAKHDRLEMRFTPKNLLDALGGSPNNTVTLHYNKAVAYTVMRIDGGSGYESWIIPRKGFGS